MSFPRNASMKGEMISQSVTKLWLGGGGGGGHLSFRLLYLLLVLFLLLFFLLLDYETFRVGKSRESFYILFFERE